MMCNDNKVEPNLSNSIVPFLYLFGNLTLTLFNCPLLYSFIQFHFDLPFSLSDIFTIHTNTCTGLLMLYCPIAQQKKKKKVRCVKTALKDLA